MQNPKKNIQTFLLSIMFIIGLFMICIMMYYWNGSLEAFPTEEQESKVQLVANLILILLIVIQVILFFIYRKAKNNHT